MGTGCSTVPTSTPPLAPSPPWCKWCQWWCLTRLAASSLSSCRFILCPRISSNPLPSPAHPPALPSLLLPDDGFVDGSDESADETESLVEMVEDKLDISHDLSMEEESDNEIDYEILDEDLERVVRSIIDEDD